MTPKEIIDYNRRCAEFLGIEYEIHSNTYRYKDEIMTQLLFHSDWNWIMELYNKLMRLPSLGDKRHPETGPLGIFTNIKYNIPDKEKTVQAINQFLIWYENNFKN